MKKRNFLIILLDSIFIVAFNILFFLNKGIHNSSTMWTCYGFLHFSYLMLIITPFIASKGKESGISEASVFSISFSYFIIEFITTLIVYFSNTEKIKLLLSINIIVTAAYFILLIINLLIDDKIENKQIKHDIENSFIKDSSQKLKYIQSIASENSIQIGINKIYNLAHSSPIKSDSSVQIYESDIMKCIDILESNVANSNNEEIQKNINEIERLFTKRNFQLKSIN